MKNEKKKIQVILIMIILVLMSFSSCSLANEESEWEGIEWKSSGNWESWDDDDYDYGYYGDYGYRYSRRTYRYIAEILIFIIMIITLYIAGKEHSVKPPPPRHNNRQGTNRYDAHESRIVSKIKAIDADFQKEELLAWSKMLFVKLQEAWTTGNLEAMQTWETTELWEQHKAQLQRDLKNHTVNITDNIRVDYAYLCGFRQEHGQDIVTLELGVHMIDYRMNVDTGKILRGNRFLEQNNTYILIFTRTTGSKTTKITGEIKCRNCGAPSKNLASNICKYCGSAIATNTNDWLLSDLQKQEKNYE